MTVVFKPYVIYDIVKVKEAKINIAELGLEIPGDPGLDMYHIKAVLKSWVEKSMMGRKLLSKMGLTEYMSQLESEYQDTVNAFTAVIPATARTIEWNKYHVGGEIMIAYYPTNVWATFHAEGEEDNNDDFERWKESKKEDEKNGE